MNKIDTEKIHFGARWTISKIEYNSDPVGMEYRIDGKLRDIITNFIVINKAGLIVTDNRVEKRVDLYIAEPDVFWKIVNEEARKIAFYFMPPKEYP